VSIKATVISQLEQIRGASHGELPPLTDDLVMLDSGLDSLGLAVLVARMEDALGLDPFTTSDITSPPVTLGDFIRVYENATQAV